MPWGWQVPPQSPGDEALEVCRDGAAWMLAPVQGDLAPCCSSRYSILFSQVAPGDGGALELA